jgi:hypothetical protein
MGSMAMNDRFKSKYIQATAARGIGGYGGSINGDSSKVRRFDETFTFDIYL